MTQRISLRGPWLYAWTFWIAVFLAILAGVAGDLWSADAARRALFWLFVAFIPLELGGALDMRDDLRFRPQTAMTLSHFVQYVATMAPLSRWYQSWRALASGFTLLVAFAAGWVFWTWHPAGGVIAGSTVFLWLIYHFLRSEKHR